MTKEQHAIRQELEALVQPYSGARRSEIQVQGTAQQKKVIITAALPYANNDLHLGHIASTYLPPDILYSYLKHGKAEVIQICASDDFGTPILIAAERAGKKPEEYVAYWRERFQQDLSGLGIDFDLFYRTSSEENVSPRPALLHGPLQERLHLPLADRPVLLRGRQEVPSGQVRQGHVPLLPGALTSTPTGARTAAGRSSRARYWTRSAPSAGRRP